MINEQEHKQCPECLDWFTPEDGYPDDTELCPCCYDQPPSEQDCVDAMGDQMYHEMRDDGEL